MLSGTEHEKYIKEELKGVSINPSLEEVHDMLVIYEMTSIYEG